MLIKRAHDLHLAALAAAEDDDFGAHHGTPQAVKASVDHIRATRGRDLPIGDISTLLSPEAAALAGATTLSNQQRRLDAEVNESATLASEMGINQGSDSPAGDDVDDDESSSDGEPSSGDEGLLAPETELTMLPPGRMANSLHQLRSGLGACAPGLSSTVRLLSPAWGASSLWPLYDPSVRSFEF
jgi:hypothetical protein